MTLEEVKKFEKNARKVKKEVRTSRVAALKLLEGTGMYTAKGNLKKAFR